jgi:hypothetical protein
VGLKYFILLLIYIVNGKRKRKVNIYKMSCKREGQGQRGQSQWRQEGVNEAKRGPLIQDE